MWPFFLKLDSAFDRIQNNQPLAMSSDYGFECHYECECEGK